MYTSRPYTVDVMENDGAGSPIQQHYTLRGLSEDEIGKWATFCESIFAYKANPPPASYFERHFYNDPRREAALIRVACIGDSDKRNETEIVASCRIFRRQVSTAAGIQTGVECSGAWEAGGIGEVCTSVAHRKRGLSKQLLNDAIEIMKQLHLQVSLLHAATTFFPVYQSVGYQCTTSEWSVVTIRESALASLADKNPDCAVRPAVFPQDTKQLCRLHKSFSESRFCGCIIRSEQYWNDYLSEELGQSLLVYESNGSIMGWASVRERGDRLQLREFGCDILLPKPDQRNVLQKLLQVALSLHDTESVKLHLPTFLAKDGKGSNLACVDIRSDICSEDDHGWMYLNLKDDLSDTMYDLLHKGPHLIWPSDSF